jgi:Protein of unknown function (DUF1091)
MLYFKKAGNEYKKTAFHLGPEKFCKYINKLSIFYDDVLEVSDFPQKGVCPWPKKKYNVSGFTLPLEKIPKYAEGDCMAEMRILQDDELINGYRLYGTIINV